MSGKYEFFNQEEAYFVSLKTEILISFTSAEFFCTRCKREQADI
jgi:hypothetical protein